MKPTRPFIQIPREELFQMKGHCVHVTWQRNAGMRWILKEIDGERVRLETQRTQKSLWTEATAVCYSRKDEPKDS